MTTELTDYQKSICIKQYNQLNIYTEDFRRNIKSTRIKQYNIVKSIEIELDESDENNETLDFVLVALREYNWSRLTKIELRGSLFVRQMLRAITSNSHNFPSLESIDVCKTDVDTEDLDELLKYVCTNTFFIRNNQQNSCRLDKEAIFISIHSSISWPFSLSQTCKHDATVIYFDNTLINKPTIHMCPLIVVGGYKAVLC